MGRKIGNYGKELYPTLLIHTFKASQEETRSAFLSIDARGSLDEDEFVAVALLMPNLEHAMVSRSS